MTQEELKLVLEALELCNGAETVEGVVIYTDKEITALEEVLAEHAMREVQRLGQEIEQEPDFFTHSVERPYDWSEWVCPDPKGYMMKCCDCGLVHEAEFSVVRYKSETEREYCDRVDDPNLQAVFRMRRSEQWSPEDTAHRTGGLPMAQPEQEPVAYWKEHAQGLQRDYDSLLADFQAQRPRVVFPTMLRKMWSGSEVQAWLDENVNKENT
jgi:hypothetical protein